MHIREGLVLKLKEEIIRIMKLEMNPDDINTDAPLFKEGLGLDSIDALELVVLLEKEYKLKIKNSEEAKGIFISVGSIADYILSKQNES